MFVASYSDKNVLNVYLQTLCSKLYQDLQLINFIMTLLWVIQ